MTMYDERGGAPLFRRARVRVVGIAVGTLCAAVLLPAQPAWATAPGLSISVPATTSFGSFATGARTITANLGTVTVTTSGLVGQSAAWTATVSATDFITGGGSAPERVTTGSVTYRSGTATAASGLALGACTPG